MPAEDLWLYKRFGAKSTELTGYPNISIFHDFKYHPKQIITGGFDWIYEHLGQFFWTVEIWAPVKEAGVEDYHFIEWYREHPPADDEAARLERSRARGRRLRRLVPVPAPAAGSGRAGRLEQARGVPQPAGQVPGAGGEALPGLAHVAGADASQARAAARRGHAPGPGDVEGAARGAQHGIPSFLRHEAGARAQDH